MDKLMEMLKNASLQSAVHIKNCFGKSLEEIGVEYKVADGDTPRTVIDTNIEHSMKDYIFNSEFKDEICLVGEEEGSVGGKRNIKLYLDPFDGTSNAAISLRMSTLGIAVEENGELTGALILNPFENKIIYGKKNEGVFRQNIVYSSDFGFLIKGNSEQLHVVNPSSTKERFAWVDPLFNAKTSPRKSGWLNDIVQYAMNVRMTGSNIDYSAKLAESRGQIQLTDAVGGFFDIAPGIVLINELGGKFTDVYGNIPKDGCQMAIGCTDPALHEKILEMTQKHYGPNSPLGLYTGFR